MGVRVGEGRGRGAGKTRPTRARSRGVATKGILFGPRSQQPANPVTLQRTRLSESRLAPTKQVHGSASFIHKL